MMMLGTSTASAQLIEFSATDTLGLGTGMVAYRGDFRNLQFTNGKMTYDNPRIAPFAEVTVMTADTMLNCVVEPGQTLKVALACDKNGRLTAKYKGKNSAASHCANLLMAIGTRASLAHHEDMEDEDGNPMEVDMKPIDVEEEGRMLLQRHKATTAAAQKIADARLRDSYKHRADVALLAAQLSLARYAEEQAGVERYSTEAAKTLMAKIEPDDSIAFNYGLTQTFIESRMTRSYQGDDDVTQYALERMRLIADNIANEEISNAMLTELGYQVIGGTKPYVLDNFWTEYKKVASQKAIDHFQSVIDSKAATASGKPCPNAAFSDPEGNPHKLSEFFGKGKYIYIDIWATWCIPCCAEIPYVEKHVEHYKDNPRLQFISISIDHNADAWHNKLAKDKPQWPQFIANKKESEQLMKDWGITGIPRFIIIAPDGTIHDADAFRPRTPDFVERMDAIIR